MEAIDKNLNRWHQIVEKKDWLDLLAILDDNVEFHSPFVWTPKHGKTITAFILKNVVEVLGNFKYHREWVDDQNMGLEFSATVDNLTVKGVDLIRFNEVNRIVHFEVMLRPANALMLVGTKMNERIERSGLSDN